VAADQLQSAIEVTGLTGLKDVQVTRLTGHEEISRPFKYELELLALSSKASDGAVKAESILGHSVTVSLKDSNGGTRHINGILSELAHVGYGERYHEYRAVLRPAFWLLTRRADCRVFQNKSVPDIFADVCSHGLSIAHRNALNGTYTPWEYRVQYRESDFDFLSRLIEHEGIYYYFEHSKGKHELVLADDVGRLSAVQGYSDVPYYPPSSTRAQRERDCLSVWQINESFQPAAFASADYDFERPRAAANAVAPVAKRSDTSKYEMFDYPATANPPTANAVEKLAKVRAEQSRSAQAIVRAGGDAVGLAAGRVFRLAQHPRKDFNKSYLVTSTDLTVTATAGQTGGGEEGVELSISLTAVDTAVPFRPACVTPKPVIQGTQTARVVGPSGKEIWTDKYGRVKVKFHWDRASKDDGNSSCWVRVAQHWVGHGFGAQYVPRIAQEVVVSFLEGDPDRPLVIGGVYNGDNLPPFELPGNATQSGVRTSTSPYDNGTLNELRFEDKQGQQEIYLHASKNMQVVVENNQTIKVGGTKKEKGDRSTTVANDDVLSVETDLKVAVKHDETRTIEGNRSAQVTGDDSVDTKKKFQLSAGDEISLTVGAAKIVMKKNGTIEISGVEVKVNGNKAVTIDGTQTSISGTQLGLKGTKTSVAGTASLDLQASGIASLKGAMTKIG
jgi:type VI secretion system secreted protein VgrG